MSEVIEVPAGGPLFEGHFPGRPILPGIAELVLVARALSVAAGTASVVALPFVRFRGLVQPGDRLDLTAAVRKDGGLRFDVRRADELVANGAMLFGAARGSHRGATAFAAGSPGAVPPIETLIPHRPPMLFAERMMGEAEDGATCIGRIPRRCALVADGVAPAFVALELAAQTAGVWEALRRGKAAGGSHEPLAGYLVSIKDVVLHRSAVPADSELIASIRLEGHAPPLTTYAVEVVAEGELALAGTIGTYLTEGPPRS